MSRLVMKFGGTSVVDAEAIKRSAAVIRSAFKDWDEIVVVVSAMAGITDLLIDCATIADQFKNSQFKKRVHQIQSRVNKVTEDLFNNTTQKKIVNKNLAPLFQNLTKTCQTIQLYRLNPQLLAEIASLGERINIIIISEYLKSRNMNAQAVNALSFIVTDNNFQNAIPKQPETKEKIKENLIPLLRKNILPVVTGFIGANFKGQTTTLGRGGSDYTASIIGQGIQADEIWILTDVDGVMTSDPAKIAEAKLIENISYNEAFTLASFGAKILHPRTIIPAKEANIPIWIKNTFNLESPGTLINPNRERKHKEIKAITGIDAVTLLNIKKRRNEENAAIIHIAKKVFKQQSIELLGAFQSSSPNSLDLAITSNPTKDLINLLENAFNLELPGRDFQRIKIRNGQSIISVIGDQVPKIPGIFSKLSLILEKVGVRTNPYGLQISNNCLSILISQKDSEKALFNIHQEVILNAKS